MHHSAKLDTWIHGPGSPAIRLAAYTPHLPGDTRVMAGLRLFKAVVLGMVSLKEILANYEMDSPRWENEWSPTVRCLEMI
jgi:hypothetical protein